MTIYDQFSLYTAWQLHRASNIHKDTMHWALFPLIFVKQFIDIDYGMARTQST